MRTRFLSYNPQKIVEDRDTGKCQCSLFQNWMVTVGDPERSKDFEK